MGLLVGKTRAGIPLSNEVGEERVDPVVNVVLRLVEGGEMTREVGML